MGEIGQVNGRVSRKLDLAAGLLACCPTSLPKFRADLRELDALLLGVPIVQGVTVHHARARLVEEVQYDVFFVDIVPANRWFGAKNAIELRMFSDTG